MWTIIRPSKRSEVLNSKDSPVTYRDDVQSHPPGISPTHRPPCAAVGSHKYNSDNIVSIRIMLVLGSILLD